MSLPKIETIRAMSSFSTSMIYVIFKDGVDLYDARSRILEQLSTLQGTFPALAKVKLGPDASGVGWAYEYALKSKKIEALMSLELCKTIFINSLLGVDGVSEVASVGGYVRNYEITLNQDRLIQYDLDIEEIKDAITKNNNDSGARVILENGYEQIISARAYLKSKKRY